MPGDADAITATTRTRCRILAVDDDPYILTVLAAQIQPNYEFLCATSAPAARAILAQTPADVIMADLQLPGETGLQFLDWVGRYSPQSARILITGTASLEDAAEAVNRCHVHRLILKPWRSEDLQVALQQVTRSLLLERSHDQIFAELRDLNQQLEQRVRDRTRELEQALHQLRMKNEILEKMALTDSLTRLPNRRAIELLARRELLRRARTPSPIAFGLIDADRFKQINADYLLSGGDQVLIAVAQTLQETMRGSDAVGRVGGEEFMVVAPNTDADGAARLGERIRSAVESLRTVHRDQVIRLTVSSGFAVAPAGTNIGYEQLRESAAAALAEAKEQGRNRTIVRYLSPEAVQ
jgi:diguanylate cyclase (GGDEF)-like protein